MRIITRYVLREHFGPLMFALCALTSLLLLNYIAKQLSQLAGKGLPFTIIAEFLVLSIPFTIAMTLPMAVLVAVLYAFTRLASENEVSAMKANGISMGSLLGPVLVASTVMAGIMLAFNDQVLPRANHRLATLQRDIARKKPTFALREQVLNEIIAMRGLTIRTSRIDRARNVMYQVDIYDLSQPRIRNIHADSGDIALTPDQSDLILKLYNGYVVDIEKENPVALSRAYFTENQMRIEDVGNELRRVEQDNIKGEREQSICDMQQKFDTARRTYEGQKFALKERMKYAVQLVMQGDGQIIPSVDPPPSKAQTTWGSVYCDGISFIGKLIPGGDTVAYGMVGKGDPGNVVALAAGTAAPGESAVTVAPPVDGQSYAQVDGASFTETVSGDLSTAGFHLMGSRKQMNTFAVEIHKKFALAGACIVFALIGVPFALRFPRGGVGLVIGASLVFFAISYVGLIAGEGLAKGGNFSPFLAMWGANFILAVVGILMIMRMGRESTGRGTSLAGFIDEMREWWLRRRMRRSGES